MHGKRGGFPALPGQGVKIGRTDTGEVYTARTVRREVADADVAELGAVRDRYMPGAAGAVKAAATCLFTNAPDRHFMVDRHAAHAQVVYHHDQPSLRASVCAANGRPLLAMMPGPASSRAMARSDRPEVGSAAIALLPGVPLAAGRPGVPEVGPDPRVSLGADLGPAESRRKGGPRDRWYVYRAPLPSREPWPVIWVWSPLRALRQEQSRRERLAAALEALGALRVRLASPKTRLRTTREVDRRIEQILAQHTVGRYLEVRRTVREDHRFRKWRRGRPGRRRPTASSPAGAGTGVDARRDHDRLRPQERWDVPALDQ